MSMIKSSKRHRSGQIPLSSWNLHRIARELPTRLPHSGRVESMSRRQLLGWLGLTVLTACAPPVTVVPRAVPTTGKVRDILLRAGELPWRGVPTWAYGDSVPGPVIRATVGDRLRIALQNDLPAATSVHWHGLAIPNAMDGVPGVTTPEVASGGRFDYDFVVPDPGTYWFHPHTGLQLDTGLYAPLIIDDPREPGDYDREWIVVLDDWADGRDPQDLMTQLAATRGMHMMMGGGDIAYPSYLVNGRPASDPQVLRARTGQRIRVRIINAAADTLFTVALGGHTMTVTHTDGFPVQPAPTRSLLIGMGERYDVLVTAQDGYFPLVAQAVGKAGSALAVLRTGTRAGLSRPAELDSPPLTASALQVAPEVALPSSDPDAQVDLVLSGSMSPYRWTINGRAYPDTEPIRITAGQSLRLRMRNMSMMSHPIHLHGHTFQLGPAGGMGARKDTVLVPAMGAVSVDVRATNPGAWMLHCHNAYHAEAGMMTRLDYT